MAWSEEQLRQGVSDVIERRIGPRAGGARRAFLAAVTGEAIPRPTPRAGWQRWWLPTAVGIAAAAAVAITLLPGRSPEPPEPPRSPLPGSAPLAVATPPAEVSHAVVWTPFEDQTVYLNGQIPARSIRGVRVDDVQWFDPELQAHVRLTVPREQVVLTSLSAH